MSLEQLATVVQTAGVVALLIFALYGLHKRAWVPGWQYTALEKDRDLWRDLYLRTFRTADKAIDLAAKDTDSAR